MLETDREVVGRHDMADVRGGISTHDTHRRGEDHQEWHDGDQSYDLRQDEITGRVDAHDLQGVDLLGDTHRTDLGGDIGTYLTSQDQTHDGTGELEEHDLAGGVATYPTGHPRALDIEFHLDTDDRSDKERDEQDDADGIDAELSHLLHILLEEHAQTFRAREGASHQHHISTKGGQPFLYEHAVLLKIAAKVQNNS